MAHPRPSAQLQWGVSHRATSDPQGRANAVLFHHKKKSRKLPLVELVGDSLVPVVLVEEKIDLSGF